MTSTALNELEATLGIQLPQEYVEVMQDYPFSGGHFGTEMLMSDVEILTRWNRPTDGKRSKGKARSDPTAGYFRIGSDGGELSFFVSPGRSSQGVWYFDIETGEFRKYCDTLRDYVDKCRRIDADDERLPNEGSHLPEWMKYGYTILILAGFVLFGYAAYRVATWLLGATGLR